MQNVPLNVFSSDYRQTDEAISEVANMINNSGHNRSQRRRLEKALAKTDTIYQHAQKRLDDRAFKIYQSRVEKNYLHFFAILAICMGHDYRWKEDESHDQISSLLERVDKTIKKYAEEGYTTEDLIKIVDEEYNLTLVPSD